MSFEVKPATRTGVIPMIDLYSESGCGKTMSALLLARGIAGNGKLVLIDTESRRGSLYADVIPGSFDALDFDAPFTPARYIEALSTAYAKSPAVVVVDSMSHEWEGIGGVNDMASANEEKSGRQGLHNWRGPKMEHQKLVQFLLRAPVPLVCCIRAKYKTRQKKGTPEMAHDGVIRADQVGKTVILKDATTSPIQAEDFIFESTVHAEILPDHSIILTKCSHPALRQCFPTAGPITVEHGQKLAQWCANPGGSKVVSQPAKPSGELAALKKQLWEITAEKHGGNKATFRQYLVDEAFIDPATPPEDLTASNLKAVISKVQGKLQPELVP